MTRSFIKFLSDVKDQEHLCRTDEMILTSADTQRRVAMKDTAQSRAWPGVQGWAADPQHIQHVKEISHV